MSVDFECKLQENGEVMEIIAERYRVRLWLQGFRYEISRPGGIRIEAHPLAGVRFTLKQEREPADVTLASLVYAGPKHLLFRLANTWEESADVLLSPRLSELKLEFIVPQGEYRIEARTAGAAPVYGLGDYGSHVNEVPTEDAPAKGKLDVLARDHAELTGFRRRDMVNQGTNMRFISNFCIFPKHGFAQVWFHEGSKQIALLPNENMIGVKGTTARHGIQPLYYFMGSPKQIYAAYRQARQRHGYGDRKPDYTMFVTGWESYGSLGWNADQRSVEEAVAQYARRGYRLAWGVIGSGFWKGDRRSPYQGTTTSFKLWDTDYEEGRTDGLPNPRYSAPADLKAHWKRHGMKLILGLRHHFKAHESDGGFHCPATNGAFLEEGLSRGYFLKDEHGQLIRITNAEFPQGVLYVLDSRNEGALEWFVSLARQWGADGFKEDAMVYTKHGADGNWNAITGRLHDDGGLIIVRNSAYGVPGDVIRINDTYYGKGEGYHFDQDRMPINLLNIAASGASNVYPDITGGTPKTDPRLPSYQNYFVRNAWFNAVAPAMGLGRRPWEMNRPEYEAVVKQAADWHNRYAPYIYSAVLDNYNEGYPYAMTPLHLAYPEEEAVHELINRRTRQYEWLIGESMLATPLYGNDFDEAQCRDIYLPPGNWCDYDTGVVYTGPVTLREFPIPIEKTPVFIGGKGIVVFTEDERLYAEVHSLSPAESVLRFTYPDGRSVSYIDRGTCEWERQRLAVMDISTGGTIKHHPHSIRASIVFELEEGHHYRIMLR